MAWSSRTLRRHIRFFTKSWRRRMSPPRTQRHYWINISVQKGERFRCMSCLGFFLIDLTNRVVLVDELDQFLTGNQKVIYNFFDWPNRPSSKLIVIAIANTMDLPERVMLNRVSSRIGTSNNSTDKLWFLGLTRINFKPYTFGQLDTIVQSRLTGTDLFDHDATLYCARKVASVSGDARRALEICRRAIDILKSEQKSNKKAPRKITLDVISRAIAEIFSSPVLQTLTHAALHQKLLLIALVKCLRSNGGILCEFSELYLQYKRLCDARSISRCSPSEVKLVLQEMNVYKWIEMSTKEIKLNIMQEDIVAMTKRADDCRVKDMLE